MTSRKKRRRRQTEPAKDTSAKSTSPPTARPFRGRLSVFGVLLALSAAMTAVYLRTNFEPPRPRNVLLVSVDTLRADHLSAYGGEVSTPHMDRLATEGVLFERVQSVSPTTLPSHASLFTARIPPEHGVRDNVGFYLSDDNETLASRLSSLGYRTGGFVGAFVLDSQFGIARGFDTYYDDFDARTDDVAGGFVSQRDGSEVLERALAWIDEVRAAPSPEPFFAFVHFYDPHTPYDPKAPFAPSEADPSALYRAEVAYTDSLVGELLDSLEARGLSGETLVVLTSDHGESLGEHGEKTHGFFVYESTLRIPLLLRYPGAPRGLRVRPFVRIVDIAPTILDVLGAPPFGDGSGASLVPLIRQADASWSAPHYAETFLPRLHYGWSELVSLRRGRHKFVLAPTPELYDLEHDPGETTNLIHEEVGIASELRAELDRVREAADRELAAADVAEETRARLESLGYVSARPLTDGQALADPKDRLELYDTLNDPALKSLSPSDGPAFTRALGQLRRVVEEETTIPRAYVLYGELLLKAGEVEAAEEVFARLAHDDPRNFEAHFGLGLARHRRGDLDGAEAAYREALAVEPRNTKSHFRLAELAEAHSDPAAAEKWLRDAIELSPNLFLQERLASLLLRIGKRAQARAVLDQMAHSGGQEANAATLYNLAQVALVDGDAAGALEMFRAAADRSPEDPDIRQGIANALAALGESAQAVAAYRFVIELSPCFAAAHANLGMTLWQLGDRRAALRAMKQSIECAPSYLPGYQNLAAAYYESGEVANAIEVLEQGLIVAPRDPDLTRALADLEELQKRSRGQ